MKTLILVMATLLVSNLANASVIRCRTATKNSIEVLRYDVIDASSQRLASDITYTDANFQQMVLSTLDVAQYKTTSSDIHVGVDDGNGNNRLQMTAVGRSGKFLGALVEYSSAGSIVRKIAVICSQTAL